MYNYLLALILFASPLMADKIGDVEYQLLSSKHGWKILNKIKTEKSTTVIYIPENRTEDDTEEFFGAHVNTLDKKSMDQNSLKEAIQLQFPGSEVTFTLLEQDPSSVIYEWSVGGELFCISRCLSSSEDLVMLSYHTEQLDQFQADKPLWIQVLKSATLVQ